MTLGKYLIFSLAVFLAGLTVLYLGVNRAPFRQAPPPSGHPMKQHGQVPLNKNNDMLFCQRLTSLTEI